MDFEGFTQKWVVIDETHLVSADRAQHIIDAYRKGGVEPSVRLVYTTEGEEVPELNLTLFRKPTKE